MNFPGNAMRLYAMNSTAPSAINATGKTYFGGSGGDYQADFEPNFFAQPRLIHVLARGVYTIPALSTATLNLGIDLVAGATVTTIAQVGTFTPVNTSTYKGWMLDELAVSQGGSKLSGPCATMPAGFTGFSTVSVGAALATANFGTLANNAAMSVDTTQPLSLKIWAQLTGTLIAGTSISCQVFSVTCSE